MEGFITRGTGTYCRRVRRGLDVGLTGNFRSALAL